MNYYEILYENLKQGSLKRRIITDEKALGSEAVYNAAGKLLASNGGFDENLGYVEDNIALKPELVLFGAGHIGKAVIKIAKILDFDITLFDDRKEILDAEDFKDIEKHHGSWMELTGRKYSFNNPYFLIFTHGHKGDEECLRYALSYEHQYIGMIGSKIKVAKTFQNLKKEGFTDKDLEKVHAPIGLDINANTPEEIAVSILAEIISIYSIKHQNIYDMKILDALMKRTEPALLCTIIDTKGSTPRNTGAMMYVKKDSTAIGSIGGGTIEIQVIKDCRKVFENKKNMIIEYNLNDESNLGMICGGDNTILFQYLE